jgi:two-component system LytT family sensor kinase
MSLSFSSLTYKQQSLTIEIAFLFFISVLSPLAVGLQLFTTDKIPFTLSLVLLNILNLPVIILFYRYYLPETVGKRRYILAILIFPIYIMLYEISMRLESLAVISLPFVPKGYRNNLKAGHPDDFTRGYFKQTIGYTSLVLLSATCLYMVRLFFKKQHRVTILEMEKLKLELNQLKSQMQPHFFFNTLNNMYSLSIQNSPKTPQMITDLSQIMRYVLYETGQEKVLLQQEVSFIKSYISLENLRHDKSGIDFIVQGNIENIKIEPLLLLPLIENTFKHALHKNIPEKWVRLVLSVDRDELIFQTSNPYPSHPEIKNGTGNGIGLANIRKRLQLLYPDRHELVIHREENTFTVTLIIHL